MVVRIRSPIESIRKSPCPKFRKQKTKRNTCYNEENALMDLEGVSTRVRTSQENFDVIGGNDDTRRPYEGEILGDR